MVNHDGLIRVVFNKRTEWVTVKLEDSLTNGVVDGHTYSRMNIDEDTEKADLDAITHGCLLLPNLPLRFSKTITLTRMYTVVRSDWKNWNGKDFCQLSL